MNECMVGKRKKARVSNPETGTRTQERNRWGQMIESEQGGPQGKTHRLDRVTVGYSVRGHKPYLGSSSGVNRMQSLS